MDGQLKKYLAYLLTALLGASPLYATDYVQSLQSITNNVSHSSVANVNCGANITDHTNSDSGNNGGVRLMKCTTGANGPGYSVAKCHVYLVAAASGNVQCGLFGATTFPLLCSTGSQAVSANSDNSITLTGCGTLAASTVFWLGFNNDTAGIAYGTSVAACTGSGGTQLSYSVTFGTWASGPSTSAGNCNYQIWLELTPL